jgi:hypothetical protein
MQGGIPPVYGWEESDKSVKFQYTLYTGTSYFHEGKRTVAVALQMAMRGFSLGRGRLSVDPYVGD